jgi:hypothetical protein
MAWHHRACWREHGRCSTCHAGGTPETQCAFRGCREPVSRVLRKGRRHRWTLAGSRLLHLCAQHAARDLDMQLAYTRFGVVVSAGLAVGGGVAAIAIALGPPTRSADVMVVAWLLVVCGLLMLGLLTGLRSEYASLREQLDAGGELVEPASRESGASSRTRSPRKVRS